MNRLRVFVLENLPSLVISALTFGLMYGSSFNKAYGYFIDEFYYIACANNPAFGYVDHPPLAPLILAAFQFVFGSSLPAIRILPALAAATTVFLTGRIAREIGGGTNAQIIASCSMAAAPMVIAFGGFFSMNAFEPVLALVVLWYTIRLVVENSPRRWIPIGIAMGLGMMNKHTFALYIICLIGALLIDGRWKLIVNKWFVFGGLAAIAIFLPNVVWQIRNDFPSLEFYRNISTRKNIYTPPMAFLAGQVMGMSPSTVPVWIAGTVFLLFAKRVRQFRFLAVLFLGLFAFLMISGTSRSDRMTFAYPAVVVGGGLFFEGIVLRYRPRWITPVLVLFLLAGLAIAVPVILPYFDYETVRVHTQRIGLNTEIERGKRPPLPQLLADRIGWEEKYALVRRAYENLPDSDKAASIIAAGNYGQAGAIELFGRNDGIAPVVCPHNTYYVWSKNRLRGSVVLELTSAGNGPGLLREFETVQPVGDVFHHPYVSSHEDNLQVFICRHPHLPLAELLERSRFYY